MLMRRIILAVCAVGLLGLLQPQASLAQSTPANFTLRPNGTATIAFEAFCTNFGQKFPQSIETPITVASAPVRGALAYIQNNGLGANPTSALEAQYAIWQLTGATGSPAGSDQAKAVVANANTAPTTPQGTSLLDAISNKQVTFKIAAWQPVGDPVQIGSAQDHFYGRGQLTITNTSGQDLTLYMPVGTLFPPTTAGDQTMAAYATNVQVNNPQLQQAPTQLPNTSGGVSHNLLLVFAFGLLAASFGVRRLRMW